MQRTLAKILTAAYEPPLHVHGFVPMRSAITNARFHREKRWLLKLDLEDFFPSINFGRILGLFRSYPFEYPHDVATTLAQLCCHRGALPQGAPTSPILSNFICQALDKRLARVAAAHHCHYTRYADDLCFSSDRHTFPSALAHRDDDDVAIAGQALVDAITSNGFTVNHAKTRLMQHTQRQRVTGLVVNERVNVPRHYTRQLRGLLHIWERYGEAAAVEALARTDPFRHWPPGKKPPNFRWQVRGRVQYIGAVRGFGDPVYVRLARTLARCDPTFRPSSPIVPAALGESRLFTEGPSDVLHFQAAKDYFANRGEFVDLAIGVDPDYEPTNDEALKDHLEGLALTPQRQPCIGIFDRDSRLVDNLIGSAGWRSLGNGVVAVALAAPVWRQGDDPLCIEMLFPDGVIQRINTEGRRLFLLREFMPESGLHVTHNYTSPNPRNRTLVRDPVFAIETNASVALSKMAFAEATSGRHAPYEDIDYEGFRPTFAALEAAVVAAWSEIGVDESGAG